VVILGTPAEEGGGGKIYMIQRGALEGVDMAMMIHPADAELDTFNAIAVHELHCEFHGEPSHAAAAPERGRNALDAAVAAYNNVAMLRQHIAIHERIHGIFTHGGDKPNVVPHRAAQTWYVRSGTRDSLQELEPRFLACIEAGAAATGCTVDHHWATPAYDDLVDVPSLLDVYRGHQAARGREVEPAATRPSFIGSTDMGNVSHEVPSIHPMLRVAPDGVSIHTPGFAGFARGPEGDAAVVDGAVVLAKMAVEVFTDPSLLARATAEHRAATGR
jgi:amidohydrolase